MTRDAHAVAADYRAAWASVERAKAELAASRKHVRDVRAELAAVLAAEYEGGARMRELVDRTGLSREWIRTLLRDAGVEPHER